MSESYAALTLLAETPNAHARGILSEVANGDWDLPTALDAVASALASWPHHADWLAAWEAVDRLATMVWAD